MRPQKLYFFTILLFERRIHNVILDSNTCELMKFLRKTFKQHDEAQSFVKVGAPGDGGAENFVWTKIFWTPGSRLLYSS